MRRLHAAARAAPEVEHFIILGRNIKPVLTVTKVVNCF